MRIDKKLEHFDKQEFVPFPGISTGSYLEQMFNIMGYCEVTKKRYIIIIKILQLRQNMV